MTWPQVFDASSATVGLDDGAVAGAGPDVGVGAGAMPGAGASVVVAGAGAGAAAATDIGLVTGAVTGAVADDVTGAGLVAQVDADLDVDLDNVVGVGDGSELSLLPPQAASARVSGQIAECAGRCNTCSLKGVRKMIRISLARLMQREPGEKRIFPAEIKPA